LSQGYAVRAPVDGVRLVGLRDVHGTVAVGEVPRAADSFSAPRRALGGVERGFHRRFRRGHGEDEVVRVVRVMGWRGCGRDQPIRGPGATPSRSLAYW
jgi:hypothetical protein